MRTTARLQQANATMALALHHVRKARRLFIYGTTKDVVTHLNQAAWLLGENENGDPPKEVPED